MFLFLGLVVILFLINQITVLKLSNVTKLGKKNNCCWQFDKRQCRCYLYLLIALVSSCLVYTIIIRLHVHDNDISCSDKCRASIFIEKSQMVKFNGFNGKVQKCVVTRTRNKCRKNQKNSSQIICDYLSNLWFYKIDSRRVNFSWSIDNKMRNETKHVPKYCKSNHKGRLISVLRHMAELFNNPSRRSLLQLAPTSICLHKHIYLHLSTDSVSAHTFAVRLCKDDIRGDTVSDKNGKRKWQNRLCLSHVSLTVRVSPATFWRAMYTNGIKFVTR